ncbi:MAG: hypothetical protein WCA49_16390 [Candidatus Sulfotelmatobacter sp.]
MSIATKPGDGGQTGLARLLELHAGVDSRLRDDKHAGARWSRAW